MRCLPPELVTPPSARPVSLADAKVHLRVDDDAEDALIEGYIDAAVGHLDGYGGILGRALMRQDWRESAAFWPASRAVELRLAPVAEILSITARAPGGGVATVPGSDYRLLTGASRPIVLFGVDAVLPPLDGAPDAMTITYRAGYGDEAAALPSALKSAILMMVGDLWRFRDSIAPGAAVPMSVTVDRLIAPFRRYQL